MSKSAIFQPKESDPQEIAIKEKLKGLLESTSHAKVVLAKLRALQENFFYKAFENLDIKAHQR